RRDGAPYFVAGAVSAEHVDHTIASVFRVSRDELAATRVERDLLGMTHHKYAQQRDGLRVVGGDIVVHADPGGIVRSINGTVRDDLPSATPVVDRPEAMALAAATDATAEVRATELVYVIATADDRPYLAWEVTLGSGDILLDRVYVDAHGAGVVDRRPLFFTARNRTIYDGRGGTFPFVQNPTRVGTEAAPPTDMVALAAHTNTGITYDCYQQLFQRDSYDGAGGTLKSLVHVKFFTPNGSTPNNAAWTGDQMVYGDGDGMLMRPLALSLDVTAHELTHGVTSSTADLAYQNESGALNEGMSDILGAVCEAWSAGSVSANTWLIGETIFTPATPNDALRYMANPTADAALYPASLGGSRDFYPDRFQGQEDQGGVHLNSGIPNLAFYLLVAGGKHPRDKTAFTVPGIGIQKAGAIFQRALTKGYFTANTNLAQARTATEQVADELYPGTKTAVGLAWAAVGVGAPPPADNVPPTVKVTTPTNGAQVAAGFAITVDASDDQAVTRVDLAIDGTVIGSATAAPYTFTADGGLLAGSHTVTATAYDVFNQASDSVTVELCDGPCDAGNPADGDGGGCGCAADPSPGSWLTWLGVLLVSLRVRRSRRGRGAGRASFPR
ncbi:MAG TPA: M4 family metallopeptidase, partial [Kofleriaceae bacterium]|nr:M4 family metallopeptidase [Kofleriaceae bacterium]